jgi:putative glycosyltransferase (TIGR04372 family)
MNSLDVLRYKFKNKNFIFFSSHFAYFIPNKYNYHLFKNSIKNGQYKISKKIYKVLSKKKLSPEIKELFFISKIIFFEVQSYLKLSLVSEKKDKDYQEFKSTLNGVNKKKISLSETEKSRYKKLILKILNEFYYCDCLIPNLEEFYKFQFNLTGKSYKNKINTIIVNDWWFQAFGHLFFFDTLLKGIKLKILNIKKISFKVNKEKISNKFFYKKFVTYTKKNKIFQKNISKKHINLDLRFWHIHKFNQSMLSENIHEYIQSSWRMNNKKNFHLLDDEMNRDLIKFEKNFGSPKNVISIHIRQDGFHFSNENAKVRNSNLLETLEIIDKIQSHYKFILLGNSNMRLNGKKFSKIINYAGSNLRSEENDYLLINYCSGHIGTTSGPSHHMLTTRIPTLYINWYPFDLSSKSDLCVLVPKILKNLNDNKYFSLNELGTIKPRILYDGISRINNKNLSFINNSNDEIENSVINFLKSLKNNNWKNYGKKFLIKERNYDFHGIKKNLNEKILLKRRTVFFDPYFAKKYKDNYLK